MSGPLTRADDPTSLRPVAVRVGAEPEVPLPLEVGASIGRFELRERVGQGGMGVVFVAYDPSLAREVAIKVLRPDRSAQLDQTRLLREAQALAQLQHANVVAVHDVGVEAGLTYLAMDYVRGKTLREWLRGGSPSLEEIADTLAKAGDGIAAAHAAGLLHRDIKPTNMLLADDGRVVVVDFGLARAAEASDLPSSDRLIDASVTQANALVGTPRYMAPELLLGKGAASEASDQFAFAVTLFEAVFGYPPFPGNTREELLAAMSRPPPTFERSLLPPIREVLRRGLAAEPADRFETMTQLVATLRKAIGFRTRVSRRRTMLVASLGAAAVLVAGGYAGFKALTPVPEVPPEVDQLEREATEAAARARYVYPSPDAPGEATALVKVLELEALEGEAAAVATMRAERLRSDFAHTLSELGDRYWEAQETRGFALDYYVQALVFDDTAETAGLRTGLTVGQRLEVQQHATRGEFSRGELVAAEPLIALAEKDKKLRVSALRAVAEERRRERPETRQDALIKLVDRWDAAPRNVDAKTPVEPDPVDKPANVVERAGTEKKADTTPAAARHTERGHTALRSRDYGAAERSFRNAIAVSPRHAPALIGLSDVFFERMDYGRAVQYAKKAVAAKPGAGRYHLKLGDAFFKVDRYREAEASYEKALELGRSEAKRRLDKVRRYLGGPE